MEPYYRAETGGPPVVVSQTVGMLGICGISILKSQYSNRWKRIFFLANGALLSYLCTISNFAKICILCRRVFHSGFQCKYMFYSSFRVKLSGIKAMAQKHLKWSISQKVLLQPSIWIKVKTSNSFQSKYKKHFIISEHILWILTLWRISFGNLLWESPLNF